MRSFIDHPLELFRVVELRNDGVAGEDAAVESVNCLFLFRVPCQFASFPLHFFFLLFLNPTHHLDT